MLSFNARYFLLTCILFLVEVAIGLYAHDNIIRPYVGDVLVVILIYCFLKSFFRIPVFQTAMWVLVFSFFIETTQYFKLYRLLGLQHHVLAKTILGTSFSWTDMLAYVVGICIVLSIEKIKYQRTHPPLHR